MTQAVGKWGYAGPEGRVRMRVPVGYDCDLRLAQRLMIETASGNARILSEPEPAVWITAFGERAVEHELRYWISDPEAGLGNIQGEVRSEEHTSELQSLMRRSYAVFCLKKKNTDKSQAYQEKSEENTTEITTQSHKNNTNLTL